VWHNLLPSPLDNNTDGRPPVLTSTSTAPVSETHVASSDECFATARRAPAAALRRWGWRSRGWVGGGTGKETGDNAVNGEARAHTEGTHQRVVHGHLRDTNTQQYVFKLHCGHNVGEAARGDDLLGQFWGVARQLGHRVGGGLRHGGNLHREHGTAHTRSGKRGARVVCVLCVLCA
jgi:hypothetical protein